jgi:hypothetical protein
MDKTTNLCNHGGRFIMVKKTSLIIIFKTRQEWYELMWGMYLVFFGKLSQGI